MVRVDVDGPRAVRKVNIAIVLGRADPFELAPDVVFIRQHPGVDVSGPLPVKLHKMTSLLRRTSEKKFEDADVDSQLN